MPILFFEH
jgi:hypothetical protein